MMKVIKILSFVILFALLTLITQIGGVIFLVSIATFQLFKKRIRHWFTNALVFVLLFFSIYLTSIFTLVPFIAERFGRVPLPLNEMNSLRPTTRLTFFLCRNYVRPELRTLTYDISREMNNNFPGTKTNYLEANFPFMNKFPLFPHLSHSDGKKLDLSFYYLDKQSGLESDQIPSFIGYGVCEEPTPSEENMPAYCDQKGYWQYDLLTKIVSQKSKVKFELDAKRTKAIINLFCDQRLIGMVFVEPHLKARMGLASKKIKFHGCQAVRHDDHLHVQLR
jgi:energy-coupling factor transporter transmembrane protein EcfT